MPKLVLLWAPRLPEGEAEGLEIGARGANEREPQAIPSEQSEQAETCARADDDVSHPT